MSHLRANAVAPAAGGRVVEVRCPDCRRKLGEFRQQGEGMMIVRTKCPGCHTTYDCRLRTDRAPEYARQWQPKRT